MHSGAVGILLSLSVGLVFGKFRMPVDAPVERLTRNIEAYVEKHPSEARGHYMLARLHYLAFVLRADMLGQYDDGDLPTVGNRHQPGKPAAAPTGKITEAEALRHWKIAADEIEIALRLESNALYHLTKACIREEGAAFERDPAESLRVAKAEYRRAHEVAWREDSKLDKQPIAGFHSLVSYEAGVSYLRIAKGQPAGPVQQIEGHVKQLQGLPIRGITPIVISLAGGKSLDHLLDPVARTSFDLDGMGRATPWPWVRPDTGLLVWDPSRSGIVTSGRQLFGTVTWWMFWENGYDALAALDDDHDGWLTGCELEGLSVWFDRNQNGRSDPGEVVPIERLGIDAICVTADGRDGESWMSSRGIRLRDGSFRPSWD